jgi:hypothetical protein
MTDTDLAKHVDKLLEMAEWFKANGHADLAAQCKRTADAFLDAICYMQQTGIACGGRANASTPKRGEARRCATPNL